MSFIILKFYYSENLIKIKGVGFLVVLSGSMEPTISQKELIVIKEQNEYQKDDIVTYKDNLGRCITHRIISVGENTVITKGDYNNMSDGEIKKSRIQGKVIFHSECLGFIWLHILKPLIIIFCLSYLMSVVKYFIFAKILLKICKYC